ncbi:MAG: Mur ligase family protein [Propionibacteriaceae bacterium]|nr:Mur ligase family protein [Propionibacteriaceae bacterium]
MTATTCSLDEALDALFSFAGEREAGHSSLEAMARAMPLLGDPHERLRVIHITGTSGKTSTSYYVQALLHAAGKRTGMTVSPHIQALNERVQIGGVPLEEGRFCAYTAEMLDRLGGLRGRLTFFELMVCLALWTFQSEGVEYAILEVGIGGERDATNIVTRRDKVGLIGPVGLDHTEKLGDTVGQIAAQKAGILASGGVGFVIDQGDEALDPIRAHADRIGAVLTVVDAQGVSWDSSLPAFQRGNWALASRAASYLAERDGFPLPSQPVMDALRSTSPPARYEWFETGGHRVLLDGAHNPQKMAGLVEAIRQDGLGPFPALATLSSAPEGKVEQTLDHLAPVVSRLVIPEFVLGHDGKVKESMPASLVAEAARRLGIPVRVVPDCRAGLDDLLADPARDLLVTGSLYLAALVRPYLL